GLVPGRSHPGVQPAAGAGAQGIQPAPPRAQPRFVGVCALASRNPRPVGHPRRTRNISRTGRSCTMKILRTLVPALAAIALAMPAVAAEKLKVGFLRVMDDAQAIAAYEGGFYEKHGLDVELVEFSSGTDLIKAIVGGQLDTGVLGFT